MSPVRDWALRQFSDDDDDERDVYCMAKVKQMAVECPSSVPFDLYTTIMVRSTARRPPGARAGKWQRGPQGCEPLECSAAGLGYIYMIY